MPTKASITTRTAKGSPLTTAEMDGNLEALRDQSIGFSDDTSTVLNVDSGNTIAIAGGDSISTAISGTTLTVDLDETITVDTITAGDSSAISVNSPVLFGSTVQLGGDITGTVGITNTTTDDSVLITTTEDSSTAAPVITMKRNSSSPADGDYIGQLKFKGENDADQEVVYAKITGKISDASDGTEDGLIEFALQKAGSNNIGARLTSTDLKLINGTGLEIAGNITTTSNGNVTVAPDGSGKLVVDNSKIEVFDDESAVDFTNYGGATVLLQDAGLGSTIGLTQAAVGPASGGDTGTYPNNIQYFIVNLDTSGTYSYQDSSTVDGDIAYAFGYNFTDSRNELYAGGGDFNITAYGTAADSYALKAIQLAGSQVNAQSELIFDKTYKETITALTDDSTADIHIDCSATSVSTFSLNDNKTFVFTNLDTGRSHTLIITNQGAFTGTFQQADSTAVKFPGGAPTVTSGAGKIDVITVFNTGSEVIGNIAQDYS